MTICWMKEGRNERQEPLQGGKAKKGQKTQNECDVRPYPLQLRLPPCKRALCSQAGDDTLGGTRALSGKPTWLCYLRIVRSCRS